MVADTRLRLIYLLATEIQTTFNAITAYIALEIYYLGPFFSEPSWSAFIFIVYEVEAREEI